MRHGTRKIRLRTGKIWEREVRTWVKKDNTGDRRNRTLGGIDG